MTTHHAAQPSQQQPPVAHIGPRGSGKTSHAIASATHLIDTGHSPDSIAIIIPAAHHQSRIVNGLHTLRPDSRTQRSPLVATAAQAALSIINHAASQGIIPSPVTVWNNQDVHNIIDLLANSHDQPDDNLTNPDIQRMIAWRRLNLTDYHQSPIEPPDPRWEAVADRLQHAHNSQTTTDVHLAILQAAQLAELNSDAIPPAFANIIIDDAHLLTPAQRHLFGILAAQSQSCTLTIDRDALTPDDRSPQQALAEVFGGLHRQPIFQDHAHQPLILQAAHSLTLDPSKPPNTQPTRDPISPPILVIDDVSPEVMDDHLVKTLQNLYNPRQRPWNSFGIIVPTPAVAARVSQAFAQNDIPRQKPVVLNRADHTATAIIALLTLAINPKDMAAFRRAAGTAAGATSNVLQRRISQDLTTIAAHTGGDLVRAAQALLPHANSATMLHRRLSHTAQIADSLAHALQDPNVSVSSLVMNAYHSIAFRQPADIEPAAELTRLITAAHAYRRQPGLDSSHNLAAFLQTCMTANLQEEQDSSFTAETADQQQVSIITAEHAHLYTWPVAVIADAWDDHYPALAADHTHQQFVTALERFRNSVLAAEDLLIVYAPTRDSRGASKQPSRFLTPMRDAFNAATP